MIHAAQVYQHICLVIHNVALAYYRHLKFIQTVQIALGKL